MSFNRRWCAFSQFVFSDRLLWANQYYQDSQADGNANGKQPSSIPSPRPPPKSKKAEVNLPKPRKPNQDFRGTKRASGEKAGSNKRRKNETPDPEGSSGEEKQIPRKNPIPKSQERAPSETTRRQQKATSDLYDSNSYEAEFPSTKLSSKLSKDTPLSSLSPESENNDEASHISKEVSAHSNAIGGKTEKSENDISEVFDKAPRAKSRKRNLGSAKPSAKAKEGKTAISESEMSEVLDEVPKAKGRKRKADSAKPTAKKTETSKSKKSSEQSTDPDAEEIKRLQGWLIKCGIRKMWHRELAPYNTSKAKTVHLRKLLADAGMTGRYSIEKASQIKEERELQADLEAVQEGAKQWGKVESDGDDAKSERPKRRLARGLQELDFLNDEDGEETD